MDNLAAATRMGKALCINNSVDACQMGFTIRARARKVADFRTIRRVHACLESTGRYSLGIARALYEAGHVISIVNPAQIRDFARTKLGRNKTDGVDASHIREYCELFKPQPWTPPSEAHRRLGELQAIRAGIVAGLTEWKNRKNSGMVETLWLNLWPM
jgi:transposase